MYATDGATLYTVDVSTGVRTSIGAHGTGLRSIGYDPRNDILYGGGQGGSEVFTINRSTGAASSIGFNPVNTIGDYNINKAGTKMYAAAWNETYETDLPALVTWPVTFASPGSDPGVGLGASPDPGGQEYIIRSSSIWPCDLDGGTLGTPVALVNATSARALEYMDGVWYMLAHTGGGGAGTFGTIDPSTGVYTAISGAGTWFGLAAIPGG
jgi:hypothetical protein